MTVLDRTEGGYTKIEDKNGVVSHRDPNGHPTNQQAFAGSKTQEKYDYEHDPDTGNFTGEVEEKEKDRIDGPPPGPDYYRTLVSSGLQYDADSRGTVNLEIVAWYNTSKSHDSRRVFTYWERVRQTVAREIPFARELNPTAEEQNEEKFGAPDTPLGELENIVIIQTPYSNKEYIAHPRRNQLEEI